MVIPGKTLEQLPPLSHHSLSYVFPRMLLLSLSSMSSSNIGMCAYDRVSLAFPSMWLTVMMNPPTSIPTSASSSQNPVKMGMMVRAVKLQRFAGWQAKSLRYLMMMVMPLPNLWHSQWKVCHGHPMSHPTFWRRRSRPKLSLEQVWVKGSSLSSCLVMD